MPEPTQQAGVTPRPPTIQFLEDCWYCTWKDLKMDETGGMGELPMSASVRVLHYYGDAPGSLELQGSLDGLHWATLRNSQGAALKGMLISASELHDIVQSTRYVRPVVSGGSALTNVTFAVMAAK